MTMHRRIASPGVAFIAVALATPAMAADVPVNGTRLVLRDTNRAARLVFVSKDVRVRLPDALSGPDRLGASITVMNPLTGVDATLALPASLWRSNRAGTVFRYDDGLVKALLRDGRRAKIRVLTTMIPISGGSQGRLAFFFEVGAERFCADFDAASIRRDVPCRFVGRRALAPGACPAPAGSPSGAFVASLPSTATGRPPQGGVT